MPTILLVEDDEAVRKVVEEHLVDTGHQVLALPDTAAARGALGGPDAIDLLIVDLVMPAGQPNGLAFATEARERLPDAPIIFITGYYGFVARSGELPGAVLYKPVDLDALTRVIGERLGC